MSLVHNPDHQICGGCGNCLVCIGCDGSEYDSQWASMPNDFDPTPPDAAEHDSVTRFLALGYCICPCHTDEEMQKREDIYSCAACVKIECKQRRLLACLAATEGAVGH